MFVYNNQDNIFLCESFASNHSKYRSPSSAAIDHYIDILSKHSHHCKKVLDVGAGTGHFSVPLSLKLPQVEFVALEPSPAMARMMEARANDSNICNLSIVVDNLQTFDQVGFDMIILSEVIHLFENKREIISLLKSKLVEGGVIVIRTPSHGQLSKRGWYKNFPTARLIDIERHPSIFYLRSVLEYYGFSVSEHAVDESRYMESSDYLNMFLNGTYSAISLIPFSEKNLGVDKIKCSIEGMDRVHFDYEMTLLIAADL